MSSKTTILTQKQSQEEERYRISAKIESKRDVRSTSMPFPKGDFSNR